MSWLGDWIRIRLLTHLEDEATNNNINSNTTEAERDLVQTWSVMTLTESRLHADTSMRVL